MTKELLALEDIILYLNAKEPKGLYCKNIEIIKTALKALEIIKEKNRTIRFVFGCDTYIGYVKGCKFNNIEDEYLYTQEEFDLLREVLEK